MPNVENLLAAEGFNFDDMPNILNDFRSFGLDNEEAEEEAEEDEYEEVEVIWSTQGLTLACFKFLLLF